MGLSKLKSCCLSLLYTGCFLINNFTALLFSSTTIWGQNIKSTILCICWLIVGNFVVLIHFKEEACVHVKWIVLANCNWLTLNELVVKNGQKVGMKLSRKGFDRVVHTENTPPVTDHPDMGAKNKKTSFFWPSLSQGFVYLSSLPPITTMKRKRICWCTWIEVGCDMLVSQCISSSLWKPRVANHQTLLVASTLSGTSHSHLQSTSYS